MERTQVRSRASSATRNDAIASERQWAIFVWRLPMGSSTPRVTVWRLLRRLGAATLTPGAALLPWREDLVERLDWLADEVGEQGGDAWVMRVSELSEAEEQSAIADVNREREQEYAVIRKEAEGFVARSAEHPAPGDDYSRRRRTERELLALQRRFRKVRDRDYFGAPGRAEAASAVDGCLGYRQSISLKLTARTDSHHKVD